MQSLTRPTDAAAALAADLTALCGFLVSADPPAVVDGSAPVAHVVPLGRAPVTPVSWEYDLSIDVWCGATGDLGPVEEAANALVGAFCRLDRADCPSGISWKVPTVTNGGYPNPDPNHWGVPRQTIACNVSARGAED
jgi:hypothetical protein